MKIRVITISPWSLGLVRDKIIDIPKVVNQCEMEDVSKVCS